jgi:hypothetical protein
MRQYSSLSTVLSNHLDVLTQKVFISSNFRVLIGIFVIYTTDAMPDSEADYSVRECVHCF